MAPTIVRVLPSLSNLQWRFGLREGVVRPAGGVQELAEVDGTPDAMHSSRKGSKGRAGASKATTTVSGKDKLYLLALHEKHGLDAPDARLRPNAIVDEFAGMQQTGGKGRWMAPPLPMCAACLNLYQYRCDRSACLMHACVLQLNTALSTC